MATVCRNLHCTIRCSSPACDGHMAVAATLRWVYLGHDDRCPVVTQYLTIHELILEKKHRIIGLNRKDISALPIKRIASSWQQEHSFPAGSTRGALFLETQGLGWLLQTLTLPQRRVCYPGNPNRHFPGYAVRDVGAGSGRAVAGAAKRYLDIVREIGHLPRWADACPRCCAWAG